jgi:O-antigen/teichoic acid export membrane protein
MRSRSLTDRTISGLVWTLSGAATQALLSLLVLVTLARLLKPGDFGVIGAAFIVIAFSNVIGQLGIGGAIVQLRNLDRADIHVAFTLSIAVALAIAAVVIAIAANIAQFFAMPELKAPLRLLALAFPVAALAVVGQGLLQRELNFKRIAAIDCISYGIGYGVVGVSLAVIGWGMWALAWAHLVQVLVNTSLVLLSKPTSIGISFSGPQVRRILHFGAGLSLARVANYIANQGDNLVVGKWLGAEALGIYGRAYQFLVMPANLMGNMFDKVLFAALATLQDDTHRLARAFARATSILAMLMLPLTGFLIVLAPEIVWLVLGPEWMGVVTPFRVLCAVLVFRTSYKLGHSLARATGAVYETAWRQAVYAAAVIVGAISGLVWGLSGVAVGVAIAIIINYLLTLQLSLTLVHMSWLDIVRIHARYVVLTVVLSASAYLAKFFAQVQEAGPGSILTLACVITFCVLILFWFFFRNSLGEDAAWLEANARERLSTAVGRLRIGKHY